MKEYFALTHKASYNFILAGILLILYELFLAVSPGEIQSINGVDSLFRFLLAQVPNGTVILSLLVLLASVAVIIQDVREGVRLDVSNFLAMGFESFLWGVATFFLMGWFMSLIPPEITGFLTSGQVLEYLIPIAASTGRTIGSLVHDIGMSFGAGFYEELFFRLLISKLIFLLLKVSGKDPANWQNQVLVVSVTAALFSLAHFNFIIGELGDPFSPLLFLFRFVFGVLMSLLLMLRGFGIAAWAHAWYDVFVFSLRYASA
jgi:hypothetical protein